MKIAVVSQNNCKKSTVREALFLLASVFLVPLGALCNSSWSSSGADAITIHETSRKNQANRPISVSRPFVQGEISNYVLASIGTIPLLTQTDVKNRWPDGSVKFAIISFVVPSLPANGSVLVTFSNQSSANNTGYLEKEDMLGVNYNFDAQIQMTAGKTLTASARSILSAAERCTDTGNDPSNPANGLCRYWLKGPVVTAVILEDRSAARSFDLDFGDNTKALHPIFECWFYAQGKMVHCGYAVENTWASSSAERDMHDVSYSLVLTTGNSSPIRMFTASAFNHIGRSRWHKQYWLGAMEPGPVRIDHNLAYLVRTKAIPNYDTDLKVSDTLVAAWYNNWQKTDQSISGQPYPGNLGNYGKALGAAGSDPWIGLDDLWNILYLYTFDDRMLKVMLGNADLFGRFMWHFREADTNAGTGHFFDAPTTGSVGTQGRVVSINARRAVELDDISANTGNDCGSQWAADKINTGKISDDGMGYYNLTRTHIPPGPYTPYLLTGEYYYLEELQYEAAYIVGFKQGCNTAVWHRQLNWGIFNDSELRGDAWSYRTLSYAAFISPDGSPEKAYFEDKLLNNIAKDEGRHALTCDVSGKEEYCEWGRKKQLALIGASPLGIWAEGNEGQVGPPVKTDGSVAEATSPWMENFLVVSLGVARDFGYPTEALLRFSSKKLFNQLLNSKTSPYLVEAYHFATILSSTKDWIRDWAAVNKYHDIPSGWSRGQDVDNGYGFIALAAVSFLYPYTVDGYTGEQAWNYFKANKPEQNRFATESPKFAILPRMGPVAAKRPNAERTKSDNPTSMKASPTTRDNSMLNSAKSPLSLATSSQPSVGVIPAALGWYPISGSRLMQVCPSSNQSIQGVDGCRAVIDAWNGGIADTKRNRLIIWGGGHADYYGNEVYALDLNSLAMQRLNNPSPVDNVTTCPEAYPDGAPSSRHSYGSLSHISHADRMFVFGGSKSSCGFFSTATWTLNLGTLQWQLMNPSGTKPQGGPGQVSDYDPNSKLVFLHDYVSGLYAYNFETNNWKQILPDSYGIDYHMNGAIDPKRKLFIILGASGAHGGGMQVFKIGGSPSKTTPHVDSSCNTILSSQSPGVTYDLVLDKIVVWPNFGNTVYLLDDTKWTCQAVTYPGGPPDSQQGGKPSTTNGTFGRFRYFPGKGIYALVNGANTDGYTLRLTLTPEVDALAPPAE
jgi:hypothetical protein